MKDMDFVFDFTLQKLIGARHWARLTVVIATRSLFIISVSIFINFSQKNFFCKNIAFTYAPTFSNNSKTTSATIPIFELVLKIDNTIILSHHWSKSVHLFESYRDDRQTDGRTHQAYKPE